MKNKILFIIISFLTFFFSWYYFFGYKNYNEVPFTIGISNVKKNIIIDSILEKSVILEYPEKLQVKNHDGIVELTLNNNTKWINLIDSLTYKITVNIEQKKDIEKKMIEIKSLSNEQQDLYETNTWKWAITPIVEGAITIYPIITIETEEIPNDQITKTPVYGKICIEMEEISISFIIHRLINIFVEHFIAAITALINAVIAWFIKEYLTKKFGKKENEQKPTPSSS